MTLLHVNIKVLLKSLLDDVTLTQARIPKSTVGLMRVKESKAWMSSLLMIAFACRGG